MAASTTGAGEATITFHNEPWTAEVARLLLEVDEGWVGYHHDVAWSWHDETYTTFETICRDRKWPCKSQAACVAMLQALRTGAINMKLSDATRSSDGCAQWSLPEMRELGAQMRRVVDGQSQTARWAAQIVAFVEAMTAKEPKYMYTIDDRTVEDFAVRAGKYAPESILKLIDPNRTNGKTTTRTVTRTKATRRTPTPDPKQRTRRDDSDDEPLLPRRKTRAKAAPKSKKRGRKRSAESDGDNAYHDPTSEDEDALWGDESSFPATQEVTTQGELVPWHVAAGEQRTASNQDPVDPGRPSLPQDDQRRPSSAKSQRRVSPRKDLPVLRREPPCQGEPVQRRGSPRQDTADQARSANGSQHDGTSTRQPTRKYQRVQQAAAKDSMNVDGRASNAKADAPHLFHSLNPYDRPGKLWGEFVVEVLLAQRTARNEDELDYVQFVRSLYEI